MAAPVNEAGFKHRHGHRGEKAHQIHRCRGNARAQVDQDERAAEIVQVRPNQHHVQRRQDHYARQAQRNGEQCLEQAAAAEHELRHHESRGRAEDNEPRTGADRVQHAVEEIIHDVIPFHHHFIAAQVQPGGQQVVLEDVPGGREGRQHHPADECDREGAPAQDKSLAQNVHCLSRPAADAACGRAFLPQAERRIFLHRGRPPYISYFSFGKIRLMSAIAATVIRHSTTPMAAPMPTFVPDATAFELMDVPKIWSYI